MQQIATDFFLSFFVFLCFILVFVAGHWVWIAAQKAMPSQQQPTKRKGQTPNQ